MNRNTRLLLWTVIAAFLSCFTGMMRGETDAAVAGGTGQKEAPGVLDYLKSISGKQIVSGIDNQEPNRKPAMQTDHIFKVVGRHPGL